MNKFLKKALSYLACTACVVTMTACGQVASAPTQQNTYKAGTYTASAAGKNGNVTVEVSFDETSITSIKVLEQAETPGIADGALENMPTKIIETQSLAVDCITGATVTSDAILAAVEDCVVQAGGNVDQLKVAKATENTNKVEEVSTDVVVIGAGVIGAGASGSAAALSALQNNKKVIL